MAFSILKSVKYAPKMCLFLQTRSVSRKIEYITKLLQLYNFKPNFQLPTQSLFEIQMKTPNIKKVVSINSIRLMNLLIYRTVISQSAIPIALYGGRHAVTMLPGAGIGPEMMKYVQQVFKAGGVPVDFEMIQIDPKSNEDLDYAITSIKRNGVAIKGTSALLIIKMQVSLRFTCVSNCFEST